MRRLPAHTKRNSRNARSDCAQHDCYHAVDTTMASSTTTPDHEELSEQAPQLTEGVSEENAPGDGANQAAESQRRPKKDPAPIKPKEREAYLNKRFPAVVGKVRIPFDVCFAGHAGRGPTLVALFVAGGHPQPNEQRRVPRLLRGRRV